MCFILISTAFWLHAAAQIDNEDAVFDVLQELSNSLDKATRRRKTEFMKG